MKIDLHEIPVRDLYDGYVNSGYDGVVGYGGALDIRPKFQREFIYDHARQQAVITTILSGFPLNVMYWSKRIGVDGYEMLDGQTRATTICCASSGSPRNPTAKSVGRRSVATWSPRSPTSARARVARLSSSASVALDAPPLGHRPARGRPARGIIHYSAALCRYASASSSDR